MAVTTATILPLPFCSLFFLLNHEQRNSRIKTIHADIALTFISTKKDTRSITHELAYALFHGCFVSDVLHNPEILTIHKAQQPSSLKAFMEVTSMYVFMYVHIPYYTYLQSTSKSVLVA